MDGPFFNTIPDPTELEELGAHICSLAAEGNNSNLERYGADADANSSTLNSSGVGYSCGLNDPTHSLSSIVVIDTHTEIEVPYGHHDDVVFAEAYAFFIFTIHVCCLLLLVIGASAWLPIPKLLISNSELRAVDRASLCVVLDAARRNATQSCMQH